tara:strand:- start:5480 stop:5968 length:489 start_codon:yes stop_codon:yes gene_type:complete
MSEQKMKELVRIANADIKGHKAVVFGLTRIFGVSDMFANALCVVNNIDKNKKVGLLEDAEVKAIEQSIENLDKVPSWLRNSRKEMDSGEDKHVVGPQLKLKKEFDIRRMKKTKSYKGMRHAVGLPVRGQRTKGHFRKGKAVGVVKKSQQKQAKKPSGGAKKK